jgi:hypothetical protein
MKVSRPFRFLLLWLGFWTGMRATDVWHRGVTQGARMARDVGRDRRIAGLYGKRRVPSRVAMVSLAPAKQPVPLDSRIPQPSRVTAGVVRESREVKTRRRTSLPPIEIALVPTPPLGGEPRTLPQGRNVVIPVARLAMVALPPPIRRRLAGSGWLIVRAGGEASAPASQLGGSQAGLRLTYPLDGTQRVAMSARVSGPLAGMGNEIALGIDWQPTRAPIHVLAEQRVAIDGDASGPMLGLVGGFGPTPVRRDLVLAMAKPVSSRGAAVVSSPMARCAPHARSARFAAWRSMPGPACGVASSRARGGSISDPRLTSSSPSNRVCGSLPTGGSGSRGRRCRGRDRLCRSARAGDGWSAAASRV